MLRTVDLLACALLMLVGQLSLGRFMPALNYLSEMKFSFILLIIIIISRIVQRKNKAHQIKSKKLPLTIIGIYLILLIFGLAIDAYEGRSFQIKYSFDSLSIAITCLILWECIDTKKEFLLLLNMISIISIFILFVDDRLWKFDRVTLMTSLSTSRIILLGLGAATFLFIEENKKKNFFLLSVASYFVVTGSLKIGLIAFFLFLVMVISVLIINKKYKRTTIFLSAILIGVLSGYANGNFDSLANRLSHFASEAVKVKSSTLPEFVSESAQTAGFCSDASCREGLTKDSYIKTLCSESANYQFCISDEYLVKDTTERLRLWSHAIHLIKEHPYFGVGGDGYKLALVYKNGVNISLMNYLYPHNIILGLAVQFGLFYVAIMMLIIYLSFIKSITFAKSHIEIFGLIAAGFAIFISSMTGGDLFDARFLFFMGILAFIYDQVASPSDKPQT